MGICTTSAPTEHPKLSARPKSMAAATNVAGGFGCLFKIVNLPILFVYAIQPQHQTGWGVIFWVAGRGRIMQMVYCDHQIKSHTHWEGSLE